MQFSFGRKSSSAALCALALLAPVSHADTLLGLYGGAQMWAMESEGAFGTSSSQLATFNYDDERQGSYYLALEHFIPLVPNVKLVQTSLDTSGSTLLNADFVFAGNTYNESSVLDTQIDMTTTDHILYYEILDNDLISIDVGINAKKIDGDISVDDRNSTTSGTTSFTGYIPMVYSKVEFGIPATSWSVFAEGSYLAIDDHKVSDINAAFEYRIIDSLALNLALQLGGRIVEVELDDLDDTFTNLEFSGVYAGVELHF